MRVDGTGFISLEYEVDEEEEKEKSWNIEVTDFHRQNDRESNKSLGFQAGTQKVYFPIARTAGNNILCN